MEARLNHVLLARLEDRPGAAQEKPLHVREALRGDAAAGRRRSREGHRGYPTGALRRVPMDA